MWDYTYDAENRLIAMQHRSEVIGTGKIATTDARRLEFKYDYLGRRVAKIVKGGWNGSSYPTTLSHGKFLYDGWNLVAEYTGATSTTLGTLVRAYTWGLDLEPSQRGQGLTLDNITPAQIAHCSPPENRSVNIQPLTPSF